MRDSLYIRGRKYKLKVVDEIDGNKNIVGIHKLKEHLIEIKVDKDIEYTLQTIVHELTHAYLYQIGFIEDSYDEQIVEFIEINYLPFLMCFLNAVELVFPKMKTIDKIKNLIYQIFNIKEKDLI